MQYISISYQTFFFAAGKKITKEKVGRIVGLDPASPLFKYNNVEDRLAETDASYVEVIHTCAGTLGFSQPLGVASFYPNGTYCFFIDFSFALVHMHFTISNMTQNLEIYGNFNETSYHIKVDDHSQDVDGT